MSEKLYDLSMVEEIAGGNEEFVKQMIEVFLETVPESIELINKYYNENDLLNLKKEAHKLKSTISTVQVPSFIDKIKQMEEIAKTGNGLQLLPTLMEEFNHVLPTAIEQIKQEL